MGTNQIPTLVRGRPTGRPPVGLTKATWDDLIGLGTIRRLRPKQIIFGEGQNFELVAVVIEGLIALEKGGCIIDLAEPGEILAGPLTSARNRGAYPITSQSLGAGQIIEINVDRFENFKKSNDEVGPYLHAQLLGRMRFIQECRVRQTAPVEARIANVILCKEFALSKGPITRAAIAKIAATSTESVIRTLSTWRKLSLIDTPGSRVRILNKPQLWKLAQAGGSTADYVRTFDPS